MTKDTTLATRIDQIRYCTPDEGFAWQFFSFGQPAAIVVTTWSTDSVKRPPTPTVHRRYSISSSEVAKLGRVKDRSGRSVQGWSTLFHSRDFFTVKLSPCSMHSLLQPIPCIKFPASCWLKLYQNSSSKHCFSSIKSTYGGSGASLGAPELNSFNQRAWKSCRASFSNDWITRPGGR